MTHLAAKLVALGAFVLSGYVVGQPIGFEELSRLDRLPSLKSSVQVASVSSYDRSGGNDDGFSGKYSFVRKESEGLILADLKGPGAIYRIWTPTPTDDLIEFLFDGEPVPRLQLKFRELFLGQHPAFPAPLAGFGVGGYYSYVPLPFAKSCVVRIRAAKMQFYQINYALYPPGSPIKTFNPDLNPEELAQRQKACQIWSQPGQDLVSVTAPPGAMWQSVRRSVSLPPRSAVTLFQADQGGRIVGMRISPASALVTKARDLLLKISYDGEPPAVICPAGDFFGYAWGQPATQSLLIGTAGPTNYCYWPMPFDRSVKVEMVSERDSAVQFDFEAVWAAVPRAPDEAKFYALWRREDPTTNGVPYTFTPSSLRARAVHDPEEIIFPAWWQLPLHAWSFEHASLVRKKSKIGGEDVRFLSLEATNQDWFGPHFLSPVCDVPASGIYGIYIETVKGPSQGKVQLFQNENPVSAPVDLYSPDLAKSGRLFLGRVPLAEGKNSLMLKLVGRNEQSTGLGLDLVSIVCTRDHDQN